MIEKLDDNLYALHRLNGNNTGLVLIYILEEILGLPRYRIGSMLRNNKVVINEENGKICVGKIRIYEKLCKELPISLKDLNIVESRIPVFMPKDEFSSYKVVKIERNKEGYTLTFY